MLMASAMMLAMVAPVANAAPKKPPNENFGGSKNSTQHRANASGKGNFGQCHRMGTVDGSDSRTLNPSAVNSGDADCRQAGPQFAAAIGGNDGAVAQLRFQ